MPRTLVAGTTNQGKLREIRALLGDLVAARAIVLRSLQDYPELPEAEETGETYLDNARLKALHYASLTGELTIGEDSGFEVDALDREPGVRSARFLGPRASFQQRFAEIYRRVSEAGTAPRSARFVCTLVLAEPGEIVYETRHTVEGVLAPEPRGTGGFGYDPILLYPPLDRTLAELTAEEKGRVSHRGQAVRALAKFLHEWLSPRAASD